MGVNCSGWPVKDVAVGVTMIVEVPDGVTGPGGGATFTLALLPLLPPPQPSA